MSKLSDKNRIGYKFISVVGLLLFVLSVAGLLVYSNSSNLIEVKNKLSQLDPYNIGYLVSVQLFSRFSPPKIDYVSDPSFSNNYSESSLEFVGDDDIDIANLEIKNTVLSIPSISAEGNVVDGLSQDSMLRGFWHFPLSKEPGEIGNVVIIGHRFHKIPPDPTTFFNLDEVKVGDKIYISQDDQELSYTVIETKVVEKNDTSVLQDSSDSRLTLITCTPLWTSDKRLVVIAVQDKQGSFI
ncbi:class D sortase [Candidatus Dojkabacteria bacterium]|nr:class D sortase [Candidatus Dojkabacteria bacterium]